MRNRCHYVISEIEDGTKITDVDGFDPIYLVISEYHEPDAALRIRQLGYKLMFTPEAHLYHCPSIDGFYGDRPQSFPRIINFITFYFRHIKLDTPDKFFCFGSYLLFSERLLCFPGN